MDLAWIDETLIAVAAIAGTIGLPKLATFLKGKSIRKFFRRADKVLTNASTLATEDLATIISDAIQKPFDEFAKLQVERDEALWAKHDECHHVIDSKLDAIQKNAKKNRDVVSKIQKDLAYVRGKIDAYADGG